MNSQPITLTKSDAERAAKQLQSMSDGFQAAAVSAAECSKIFARFSETAEQLELPQSKSAPRCGCGNHMPPHAPDCPAR